MKTPMKKPMHPFAEEKLRVSFNLGIAGYIIKPVDYPKFVEVMRSIQDYWSHGETVP
jgi:response regulator of citrate/malate metabolism